MADKLKFGEAVGPFVDMIEDIEMRGDIKDALALMREFDIELVPAEKANKGVPTLRKASRNGIASVIVNRGTIRSLKDADIMMSVDQLVKLMGAVYDLAGRQVANRRAADALLEQLDPTHLSLAKMRIGRRHSEQTVGGRRRLG